MEGNDISEAINKFSDILKDKNINLNDFIDDSIKSGSNNDEKAEGEKSGLNIDINTILKFKSILEKVNNSNNPRTTLLLSLKPFLSKEKQDRIDEYIKISNILSILEIVNDDYVLVMILVLLLM